MAPELLIVEDDSQTTPTTQMDVYSFGSIMLQVCNSCAHFVMTWPIIHSNDEKILTGSIPYHYLSRDEQVLVAILQGKPPRRPDEVAVTERRWKFVEWCWSPAKGTRPRPCSDEIVRFTKQDLARIMATGV